VLLVPRSFRSEDVSKDVVTALLSWTRQALGQLAFLQRGTPWPSNMRVLTRPGIDYFRVCVCGKRRTAGGEDVAAETSSYS
jgi:hypothetical protein